MFDKIDHIGIAVHSIEESTPLYRDTFKMEYLGEDVVEAQGVRVASAEPDGRVRLLDGLWLHREVVEMPELPLVGYGWLSP